MTIKEQYKAFLKELARQFSYITGKRGEWFDTDLWATEYEAWGANDMLYIVDNYPKLLTRYADNKTSDTEKRDMLLEDIEAWIDYNVDVSTFGIAYINLKSWLAGCPRMSATEIDTLKKHRQALDALIGDFQTRYGKLDTNPQPEHLRNLKA